VKRSLVLALALAACGSKQPPLIVSFTVDNANPDEGAPVTFSFSVAGASGIVLLPQPGAVTHSPVTVVPSGTTTFTLRASNDAGATARNIDVIVRTTPLTIAGTDAVPGQTLSGAAVTLSWSTTGADHATIGGGELAQPVNVDPAGSLVVHPAATTSYTLTAFNKPGRTPASVAAPITARVFSPPSVNGFSANPGSILQGGSSTLRWQGNAVSYSVSDGTTTFHLGPRLSLVVRPAATTTYTLSAQGVEGLLANPMTAMVTITPHAGSTLAYTGPASAPLQLVPAAVCNSPCTSLALKIVATSAVQLRGAALDLPLDTTKVGFDPSSFSTPISGAVPKAGLGSGALEDTLVLGVALKGTGTAPASDVTLNAGDELARFTLTLLPAGGAGVVFDGAALASQPASAFKAVVQSAAGRAANAIAVGRLEAQ